MFEKAYPRITLFKKKRSGLRFKKGRDSIDQKRKATKRGETRQRCANSYVDGHSSTRKGEEFFTITSVDGR